MKEQLEGEIVTQRNLIDLQRKINMGWTRSQIKKEELKNNALETLNNFNTVLAAHERIEHEEQSKKLQSYLERKKKKMAYFQKWEKDR